MHRQHQPSLIYQHSRRLISFIGQIRQSFTSTTTRTTSSMSSSHTDMVSPLQAKGLTTLSLLLVAQNVAFCNAVAEDRYYSSFFSTRTGSSTGSNHQRSSSFFAAAYEDGSTTCPSQPPALNRFWKNVRNSQKQPPLSKQQASRCCTEHCAPCMESFGSLTAACVTAGVDKIPRGGAAVDAAAAAVGEAAKTPYNIPLNAWKVIFQAMLTAINVLCWLVPLRNKAISDNALLMSLANAFSGGVFLSLAFGHLIPECIHGFEESSSSWSETAPYLFVLAGYVLIFFVEKVAFDAHDIMNEMQQQPLSVQQQQNAASPTTDNGSKSAAALTNGASSSSVSEASPSSSNGGATTGRSALILLGALGIHSILEMMALGLTNTFSDGALLTLSIALHQPAESIALLVAFLKSGMPRSQIVQYLSVFACMGPIGVALGMAVNEYAAPIVDAIMLSIVAGTFVYVGATEVIPEEFEDAKHKWRKFGALMSGIVTILCITQYTTKLT